MRRTLPAKSRSVCDYSICHLASNRLVALLSQSIFERDRKECMAKLRRVVRIPEKRVIGVTSE
jgi:hypothetical protein